jgi:hypothetical protein
MKWRKFLSAASFVVISCMLVGLPLMHHPDNCMIN